MDKAKRRLEKWIDHPEQSAWHACKRIFAYALMIQGGLAKDNVEPYLLKCSWFQDFSRHAFQTESEQFVQPFIEEITRSKAAEWQSGRLVALAPHKSTQHFWNPRTAWPDQWQ